MVLLVVHIGGLLLTAYTNLQILDWKEWLDWKYLQKANQHNITTKKPLVQQKLGTETNNSSKSRGTEPTPIRIVYLGLF